MSKQRKPRQSKDSLNIFGPAVLLVLLGFILAYQFVKPAPPDHIRLASGQPDGAYYLFGQQYRKRLLEEKIHLEVLTSAGSIDNIGRLTRCEVDAALVQGGTTGDTPGEASLLSLGSLYFEPIWVFYRKELSVSHLTDLQGKRTAIGAEGSGTRSLALRLLAQNDINPSNSPLLESSGRSAADALLEGKIDSAFFVASPMSPVVRALLDAEHIQLMSFERAEAYTRTHRFLSSVTLPEGVINLKRNLPDRPTTLLAASANLVVRDDLHPALMDLLLQAAQGVHERGGWFEESGQFPAPEYLVYPLSSAAERFYKYGPPLLQRYLPFWAATLVDRLKVMLLPFLALMIPLFKIMPPIYRWRMRSRIYRWYREVLAIDHQLFKPDAYLAQARSALDQIEYDVSHIEIPLSYAEELYDLRLHISLIQQKLERRARQP
ncbi:TAXI family TRAP transporter solute-binding subunit [Sedimenticola selenatireducens]|uniref:C4-dicarboxylate ABC transporter substrate-binding protein n=1 Tax=Sedimenticola selenatireducens TaxID=191960 RepID=A0A2N6CTX5_9GAMM|nr:TAXI family TRAP transporter solute-binding subunit [Sedimenticola selenatireducens]PLX60610.1 MAG: C4-dicarboxylate ABC transporter substrate-binding protein [Sedimenticola selenatireducens]